MAELQAELLARAAAWVKPGGTLVYATCSLERAEGEEQIPAFLAAHKGWTVDPARADELPPGIAPDASGFVRTLPGMLAEAGGLDGFFIARLRAPAACIPLLQNTEIGRAHVRNPATNAQLVCRLL